MNSLIEVKNLIYEIRGYKVMLDSDLAELYEVQTFRLNEAVKRNIERFPSHYMFQLTKDEYKLLTSQIAISKKDEAEEEQCRMFSQNKVLRCYHPFLILQELFK